MTVFSSLSPSAVADKMLYVSCVDWCTRRSSRATSGLFLFPVKKHEVPFR